MILTLNKPNKIISIHKDDCEFAKSKLNGINLNEYPNGYATGENANQLWFNEKNFTTAKAQIFFGRSDFCKVFCSKCCGGFEG